MFKVECPGCTAPYQVDERRVPSSGLKMRCPKCGVSFQVERPADPRQTGPSPVLGASFGAAASASGMATRGDREDTILGVSPPGAGAFPSAVRGGRQDTILGVSGPAPGSSPGRADAAQPTLTRGEAWVERDAPWQRAAVPPPLRRPAVS